MDDFFGKLGAAISEAGRDVSQKSRELTGVARLRIDINSKEDYIQKLYTQIGKKYYDMHKEDVEPLFEELALIVEAKEEIRRMENKIAELKGLKQCPVCGKSMPEEAQFCQLCGTKYESVYEEEA